MTLKKVAGISIAALMAGMMITTAHAEDGKYVQNSDGQAVKNSVEGTCVNSQFGSMPEGCEAAPPPAPPPAPVPPPAPAPAPIRQMTLNSDANFDFDKATLKPAGKANLDQFLGSLAGAKVTGIGVVGHTDSVGSDAYNQKLSEKRAVAVADYLVSKGVPAAAIQASGRGESQPVASNSTKAGRATNRRVEVTASGTR
ncbi:OmpA family protein [Candidatus Thiothrix sp. Deng01]|uniref:OmpA family protein n=1 Tax=Candidatus Thiothrix phosphatis TaxID=3112415 RepID=A0ABU6D077_9GAMM|nr:OmpA family protein [Candidatus Thiothrix sp. Deng01]MEB4592058.1 OmpA family protein [Candidatus Thiothrix sp. Deng01]